MSMNVINGVLRAVLPAAIAYVVGKGWLSSSSAADVSAAVIALLSAGWSVQSNTKGT